MLNQIDLSRFDLNLLVLFEVVLAEGHVGRAAERLCLSPSAVSHGLRRLRAQLHDPLFLKTPKGVVPTARALELAQPVADVLNRVREVVGAAAPFDTATSRRRFVLGAPDAASAVILPPLLAAVAREAPGVDLSVKPLMPQQALAALDVREVDIAVAPLEDAPARFSSTLLYEEIFVVAMRAGHPLATSMTLESYCAAAHVVVSPAGDPYGNVDEALAARGLVRRVAVTAPNFMFALAAVAETDLVAALPRGLVRRFADVFSVVYRPAPVPMRSDRLQAVATRAAMADRGVAWLMGIFGALDLAQAR